MKPKLYAVNCPVSGLLNMAPTTPVRSGFLCRGGGVHLFSTKRAAHAARIRTAHHARQRKFPWAHECRQWRVVPVSISAA